MQIQVDCSKMASKFKTGSQIRTVVIEKSSFNLRDKEEWADHWRQATWVRKSNQKSKEKYF